jgi:hypothetical protein
MPREHQSPLVPEAHEEFQAKKETTSSEKKDTSVFEVSEDISPSTWQGIEYSRRGDGGNFQKFVGEKPAGTYVFETTRSLVGDGGRREPVAAVVREGDVLTVLHTALVSGLDGTSRAELVVQGASRKQLQRESGFGLSFATLKNDQVNYEGMKREQDRHLADPVFISEHVYQPGHFRDMLLQTIDALQDGNVNKITLPTSGAGSGVASVLDLLQDRRAIIGVRDARVPDVPAEDLRRLHCTRRSRRYPGARGFLLRRSAAESKIRAAGSASKQRLLRYITRQRRFRKGYKSFLRARGD